MNKQSKKAGERIAVIGCGRWGSLITWYLDSLGFSVTLYGRSGSTHMERFLATRSNDLLTLPESVQLTTDIHDITLADTVIISIDSQGLDKLVHELAALPLRNKAVVLCMKGIEVATGRRLSEVARDALDASCPIAVWLGPGHVQEFYHGIPNCMVIDSDDEALKRRLVDSFSGKLIRFYYGQDLIGNEIGAAAKNVIGIAAGMLDGIGLPTLKGALMSRGTREVARLICAMGGKELSAYGLCHLGDYEATLFSPYSHNRMYGERFVKNEPYTELAEGAYTVLALLKLGERYHVDLPICQAVDAVLYHGANPRTAITDLMTRELKNEFN